MFQINKITPTDTSFTTGRIYPEYDTVSLQQHNKRGTSKLSFQLKSNSITPTHAHGSIIQCLENTIGNVDSVTQYNTPLLTARNNNANINDFGEDSYQLQFNDKIYYVFSISDAEFCLGTAPNTNISFANSLTEEDYTELLAKNEGSLLRQTRTFNGTTWEIVRPLADFTIGAVSVIPPLFCFELNRNDLWTAISGTLKGQQRRDRQINNVGSNTLISVTTEISKPSTDNKTVFFGRVKDISTTQETGIYTHDYSCLAIEYDLNFSLITATYENETIKNILQDILTRSTATLMPTELIDVVRAYTNINVSFSRISFFNRPALSCIEEIADLVGADFSFTIQGYNDINTAGNVVATYSNALILKVINNEHTSTFTADESIYNRNSLKLQYDGRSIYNDVELEGISASSGIEETEDATREHSTLYRLQHEYAERPDVNVLFGGEETATTSVTVSDGGQDGQLSWDKTGRTLTVNQDQLDSEKEHLSTVGFLGSDVAQIGDTVNIFVQDRLPQIAGGSSGVCFRLTQGASIGGADLDTGQFLTRLTMVINTSVAPVPFTEDDIKLNVFSISAGLGNIGGITYHHRDISPAVPFYTPTNVSPFVVDGITYQRDNVYREAVAVAQISENIGNTISIYRVVDFILPTPVQANPDGKTTFIEISVNKGAPFFEHFLVGNNDRTCTFYNRVEYHGTSAPVTELGFTDNQYTQYANDTITDQLILQRNDVQQCPLIETYWSLTDGDNRFDPSDIIRVTGTPIIRKVKTFSLNDGNTQRYRFYAQNNSLVSDNDFLEFAKSLLRKNGKPNVTGSFTIERKDFKTVANPQLKDEETIRVGDVFEIAGESVIITSIQSKYVGIDKGSRNHIYNHDVTFSRNQLRELGHIVKDQTVKLDGINENLNQYQRRNVGTVVVNPADL